MAKFKVECQALVELEIEAESMNEAEDLAGYRIIEKCLYDADSIDWGVYAHEQ